MLTLKRAIDFMNSSGDHTPLEKVILLYFMQEMSTTEKYTMTISAGKIATKCKCSPRSVQRVCQNLRHKGVLIVTNDSRVSPPNMLCANTYAIKGFSGE